MKKLAILGALGALLLMAVPAMAKVDRVQDWDLTASTPIAFGCGGGTYNHTLNAVTNDPSDGSFVGNGTYDPNILYTWGINGDISENDITFTLVYTGINAGYTLNGIGVIAADGSISGTTDGNCQTFSMPAGAATPIPTYYKNHGQYVKSQPDKKAAAHSRIGMPAQSKGHTK